MVLFYNIEYFVKIFLCLFVLCGDKFINILLKNKKFLCFSTKYAHTFIFFINYIETLLFIKVAKS